MTRFLLLFTALFSALSFGGCATTHTYTNSKNTKRASSTRAPSALIENVGTDDLEPPKVSDAAIKEEQSRVAVEEILNLDAHLIGEDDDAQNTQKKPEISIKTQKNKPAEDQISNEDQERIAAILDRIRREPSPHLHSQIPLEINSQVQKWVHYFSVEDRERFARFLSRGTRYRRMVEHVFSKYGIPRELYYLGMIESGYVTDAKSSAKAVGIWQFMKGTGQRYGLKVNRHIDERRDPLRSTHAAAKYLKTLYNEFHSWYLAMAAYNAGEGRIRRAIVKGRSNDFWKLAVNGTLPQETVNYVPKYLAAVLIGTNPTRYGFRFKKRPHQNDTTSQEARATGRKSST